MQMQINPKTPVTDTQASAERGEPRKLYRWERAIEGSQATSLEKEVWQPDISLTTFVSWRALAERLMTLWRDSNTTDAAVEKKVAELTKGIADSEQKLRILYGFVSKEIRTI